MSMSEFENEHAWDNLNIDSALLLKQEFGLPDDFTAEDIAFAQEMESLFSPEQEEMPPLFVQTILDVENPQFGATGKSFEYKTQAHVFRRLRLRRRLFSRGSFPIVSLPSPILKPSRSVVALLAACLLFVVFTMVATGPSFASGLSMLLSGHHSGVLLVNSYPHASPPKPGNIAANTSPSYSNQQKITLLEAQQRLEFQIYRPITLPDYYSLNAIRLYQGLDQTWVDGPALELEYTYARQGGTSHGTGKISVFEFKPQGQVLQVVQRGAAHALKLGADNQNQAVYVDGQWVRINKFAIPSWRYGSRSEIIYEHNGVIFWIVGDQRDGIGQQTLLNIANSLQAFDMRAVHFVGRISDVTVSSDDTHWLFADDMVYAGDPDGNSLEIISADFPSVSVHTTPSTTHHK